MDPTDSDLISRFLNGDSMAFEQLVYRYDRSVLSIAARYTNCADDAKDIYQETFIRVFKGLPKFKKESEFSTWLFRITTNVCLTRIAMKKKEQTIAIDRNEEGDDKSKILTSDHHADIDVRKKEISSTIHNALQHLSPQQRMVFILRHYHEHKIREIAETMNCAEGTIKKYLFEATRIMRIHLHDLMNG
jgi:RNA polymerase sigma-70 factor (ECF subfamily)